MIQLMVRFAVIALLFISIGTMVWEESVFAGGYTCCGDNPCANWTNYACASDQNCIEVGGYNKCCFFKDGRCS